MILRLQLKSLTNDEPPCTCCPKNFNYSSVTSSFLIRPQKKCIEIVSKLLFCIVILFSYNVKSTKYCNFYHTLFEFVNFFKYIHIWYNLNLHQHDYVVWNSMIAEIDNEQITFFSGFSFPTPLRDQSWPFLPKSRWTTELHASVTATS